VGRRGAGNEEQPKDSKGGGRAENGPADGFPKKLPIDQEAPRKRSGHAAWRRHNLAEARKIIRVVNRTGREFHN
jgi:hypothetical protein